MRQPRADARRIIENHSFNLDGLKELIMATLTRNTIVTGGLELASNLVAADVGLSDEFVNDGSTTTRTYLVVANGGGVTCNVTVDSQVNCSQGFDHDSAVAVAAGITKFIGPFEKGRWNNPTTKKVSWSYDQVASVTVGVFELLQ
jgi:hypothetical protein